MGPVAADACIIPDFIVFPSALFLIYLLFSNITVAFQCILVFTAQTLRSIMACVFRNFGG